MKNTGYGMENGMNNRIGGNIYAHRRVKGITQEELGRILSVSGTAVSKWERGVSYS